MLQASDYQARASVFPFANGYVLDNQYLRMQLLPAAIGLLSDTGPVQYRNTLTYETFSNYDGMAAVRLLLYGDFAAVRASRCNA